MSIRRRIRSFGHAFRGLFSLFRDETNAKIHLAAVVIVTAGGIWRGLTPFDWALIVMCFGAVISAEAFNTSIERLADVVSPDTDPRIRTVKDLAAAGVLVVALAAVGVGIVVFFL